MSKIQKQFIKRKQLGNIIEWFDKQLNILETSNKYSQFFNFRIQIEERTVY